MYKLFDAHNHILALFSDFSGNFAPCASIWEHWGLLQKLEIQIPALPCGYGIHPWYVQSAPEDWQTQMEQLLTAAPQRFVGETGLDYAPRHLSTADLQKDFLHRQLILAQKWQRPVVLHAVRSLDAVLHIVKSYPPPRFLIHRFGGSSVQAQQITDLGGYVSVHSDSFNSAKTVRALQSIAPERILVESDWDAPQIDPQIWEKQILDTALLLSQAIDIPLAELLPRVYEQTLQFYGVD